LFTVTTVLLSSYNIESVVKPRLTRSFICEKEANYLPPRNRLSLSNASTQITYIEHIATGYQLSAHTRGLLLPP